VKETELGETRKCHRCPFISPTKTWQSAPRLAMPENRGHKSLIVVEVIILQNQIDLCRLVRTPPDAGIAVCVCETVLAAARREICVSVTGTKRPMKPRGHRRLRGGPDRKIRQGRSLWGPTPSPVTFPRFL